MKKTIAILLVLVIGMVGVWAADETAKIEIYSSVPAYNAIKITNTPYTFDSPFTYSTFFDSTDEVVESTVTIDETNFLNKVTVGYLSYFTNTATTFTTTVKATPLADAVNLSNTSKIGYSVYLTFSETENAPDYDVVVAVAAGDTEATGSPYKLPVTTNAVSTGSSPIVVELVENDFRTALASVNYEALITFEYTTT